eukprot:COSAG01_NODE_3244_length_6360_cov_4.915988_1_plen_90_part_00
MPSKGGLRLASRADATDRDAAANAVRQLRVHGGQLLHVECLGQLKRERESVDGRFCQLSVVVLSVERGGEGATVKERPKAVQPVLLTPP